jgi:hypothetical protein
MAMLLNYKAATHLSSSTNSSVLLLTSSVLQRQTADLHPIQPDSVLDAEAHSEEQATAR